MPRTAERRRAKKQRRNTIPGVPSYHAGGFVHNQWHRFQDRQQAPSPVPPSPLASLRGLSPEQIAFLQEASAVAPQLGMTVEQYLARAVGTKRFGASALTDLIGGGDGGGGGGGFAAPQWRPGEFGLEERGLGVQEQQNRLQQEYYRGQIELGRVGNDLTRLRDQRAHEIARGELQLAQRTEARIRAMELHRIRLDQQRLILERSLGGAQGLAGLAASRGDIEARRQQFLSELAANPRDFPQYQIAAGGGTSFLPQILSGQAAPGQSPALAGATPYLGAGYQRLLEQVTARPDVPLFKEAEKRFRTLPRPRFQRGGSMVVDEPVVGVGQRTGQPRFTMSETNPELLTITPMRFAGGGGGRRPISPALPAPVQEAQQRFGEPGFNIEDIGKAVQQAGGLAPPVASPLEPLSGLPPYFTPEELQLIEEYKQLFQQGQGSIGKIGQVVRETTRQASSPGRIVRQLMAGLNARARQNLLPSQRSFLEGIISFLGVPPEDFWTALEAGTPRGADPSQVSFGSFNEGGEVLVMQPRMGVWGYAA